MRNLFGTISGACVFSLAAAALLAGGPDGGKGKPNRAAPGTWGAQGINVEVTETGAVIEYDCGHGSIDEVIKLDSGGHFQARGVHVRERPGPIREGEQNGEPAIYSGHVEGDTMTLTVKLAGAEEAIGTFTLVHGKRGRIRKCM